MLQIPHEKLKEFLLKDGLVSESDFSAAQEDANRLGQDLGDVLISRGIINERYLLGLISNYFGVESTNLDISSLDESVVKLLPEEISRKRRIVVFKRNADNSYDAAMENPSDLETIEFVSNFLKSSLHPFLTSSSELSKAFSVYSREFTKDFKKTIEENIRASLESKAKGIEEAAADVPIVALVDNILSYAVSLRASDIHIEILESYILIRYRIDGILHEIMQIPKEIHAAIIARIKLLSQLKMDEHSKPQDGRFRYELIKENIDIRVSIMPTFHGEKIVMRLLPAAQKPLSLEELGIHGNEITKVIENINKTYGMALVCGPTGSGKTTTLYSILNILNKMEVNIVTVEDPIEYEIKYVNQTQINPKSGITFASGLRSILRQDPNIILVGEIRDEETAEISVHSALTGHLVLSSLHTNDAPTAIPRFIDMKVVPFLVAAVINVIIAQRLVRKICPSCIYSYTPDKKVLKTVEDQIKETGVSEIPSLPKVLFKGKGCPACGGSGYQGRIGIFEILSIDDEIRELIISQNFSLEKLKEMARKKGMVSMFDDGIRKTEIGVTTLEEVLRVIRE